MQQRLGGQAVRCLPRVVRFRDRRRGENLLLERAAAIRPGRRNPRRQRRQFRCATRRDQHRGRPGRLVLRIGQRLHHRHGFRVPPEARVPRVARVFREAQVRDVAVVHDIAAGWQVTGGPGSCGYPGSRASPGRGRSRDLRVARARRAGRTPARDEGGLRILVVRCYRLHPLAPAGPAAEGREVLVVLTGRRAGVRRVVVRVFAEDLRRIVVHRHGSSLLVLMGGRAGSPGSGISSSVSQTTRDFDTQRT